VDTAGIEAAYRDLSWEQLLALARENSLSYIIQFADIPYPVTPIHTNERFAVYQVDLAGEGRTPRTPVAHAF
jgi:hypothetical protein